MVDEYEGVTRLEAMHRHRNIDVYNKVNNIFFFPFDDVYNYVVFVQAMHIITEYFDGSDAEDEDDELTPGVKKEIKLNCNFKLN